MADISAFRINGPIDTNKNILTNISTICTAAGCWISYDTATALWSVVINKAGSSTKSFTDSNIIGSINVSGTGIDQLYNSVEVQYPLQDIKNSIDYVNLQVANADRFPYESDKMLSIQLDVVNNPVQAQYVGQVQLKQNRVDKIINFTTDFTALGLKGGDLIDVTNTMYGYTNKVFRVISVTENDAPDSSITLDITALEYDANVYSSSGLTYTSHTTASGIVPLNSNSNIQAQNAAGARGLITVSSFQTGILTATVADGNYHEISLGKSATLPYTGKYHTSYSINWGGDGAPTVTIGGTVYAWGVGKNSALVIKSNGTIINDVGLSSTGDRNVPLYEDHFLDAFYTGTAGQVIDFYFKYSTNWGGDYGGNGGAGTQAQFLITSETKFNGLS